MLYKQHSGYWFQTPRGSCDVIIMERVIFITGIFMMTSSNGNIFSALLALCAGNSPVPVNSPHKGQWRGALMFSLIYPWINDWVNNREAGDFRRQRGHYDVIVMSDCFLTVSQSLWRWEDCGLPVYHRMIFSFIQRGLITVWQWNVSKIDCSKISRLNLLRVLNDLVACVLPVLFQQSFRLV